MRLLLIALVSLGGLIGLVLTLSSQAIHTPTNPLATDEYFNFMVEKTVVEKTVVEKTVVEKNQAHLNRPTTDPTARHLLPEDPAEGLLNAPLRWITALLKPVKPPVTNQVETIARQVTVRVLTHPIAGSGVLLRQQSNTYWVLTCDHVVAESKGTYNILTSDGKTYAANRLNLPALRGLDLAVLQFRAETSYPTTTLGNSDALATGAIVYASGFPNYYYYREQNLLESTAAWGVRAYQLTQGQYRMSLERPLVGGYQLGYTNEVEQGMSGGPVLDEQGHLVGINGRLKFPIQGIDAYTFTDGTQPSQALFQQMEALSWAIPVSLIQQTIDEGLVETPGQNNETE